MGECKVEYIVRLYKEKRACLYLAAWRGDPGRTYDRYCARRYKTASAARSALTQIRNRYDRPFKGAGVFIL